MTDAHYVIEICASGYGLSRSGEPLKTPAGHRFIVPTRAVATEVLREWNAQPKKVNFATMPFAQLANTAIDILAVSQKSTVDELALYARSDLLSHHVTDPVPLATLQTAHWAPIIAWANERFRIALNWSTGIMPIAQSPDTLHALRNAIGRSDIFVLAGLQQAVHATGSLILGLALRDGFCSALDIFAAAEIEVTYQIETWGEDPALAHRRSETLRALQIAEHWFESLKTLTEAD